MGDQSKTAEREACQIAHVSPAHFNRNVVIPFGLRVEHVCAAMNEFSDFLGFLNLQLHERELSRLEAFLMPANFSSIVGEFMTATIPKHCPGLVKNRYHNGHPDLIPKGAFPNDAVQHDTRGIEVKGSRYVRGWQGHNAEDAWLMVFCFEASRATDSAKGVAPKPFRFLLVAGAQLEKSDWTFSGRSATSRRTITASVNGSGYAKMMTNWIYKAPNVDLHREGNLLGSEVESGN